MHDNEFMIDVTLVRELLAEQFPQWADLPMSRVQSDGTDNAVFLLGTDMCVRLPRIVQAAKLIENEQQWLPVFAGKLPLAIPTVLGKGIPNQHFPWHWSVYRWLEGTNAASEQIADLQQAAIDLAQFLIALQRIDTTGGPLSRRGVSLATQDHETRSAIKSLQGIVDVEAVTAVWQECLQADAWSKAPVWIHGDLLPANLLVQHGRLSAVIDFGCFGIGDPACDLIVAWSLLTKESREIFRRVLAVGDATWMRGRGWALSISLIILPYYQNTNPGLVAVGKRIITQILDEWEN